MERLTVLFNYPCSRIQGPVLVREDLKRFCTTPHANAQSSYGAQESVARHTTTVDRRSCVRILYLNPAAFFLSNYAHAHKFKESCLFLQLHSPNQKFGQITEPACFLPPPFYNFQIHNPALEIE